MTKTDADIKSQLIIDFPKDSDVSVCNNKKLIECDEYSIDSADSSDIYTDNKNNNDTDNNDTDNNHNKLNDLIKIKRDSPHDFAKNITDNIILGEIDIESNNKAGLVRFMPITNKAGENYYICLNDMKDVFYLQQISKYKKNSNEKYDSYVVKVKEDDEDDENADNADNLDNADNADNDNNNENENKKSNPDRKYVVDVLNDVKRNIINQIKGYTKLPIVEDQTEYFFSIRNYGGKFYNSLGYKNKTYTLDKKTLSNILRSCEQNYILLFDGIRITDKGIYIVALFIRSIVPEEIIDQVKYHDIKMKISEIVNKSAQKNIKKLKYYGYVDLNKNKYMQKDLIFSKIQNIAKNISNKYNTSEKIKMSV